MSLVVLEEVSLAFGGRTIVDGASLRIGDGDRVGLVGPNGSGKTTLFRLLAGEQAPDSGRVTQRNGLRLGYLPQDMDLPGGSSLLSYLHGSAPGRSGLLAECEAAEDAVQRAESEEAMLEAAGDLADAHEQLAALDVEFSEHRASVIASGLGFRDSDLGRDLDEFSGGWKMRAVLAALLFSRPDLLLLDEPTNHLDFPSVGWLLGFLRGYDRAFVLISHDRDFLNELVSRIVSFEMEGLRSYTGNYVAYQEQRAEESRVLENRARNVERKRQQMERFVERFRAKATKATQAQSRLKQLEKLEDVALHRARRTIDFAFPPCDRAGRDVLRAEGLAKAYGDVHVLDPTDAVVSRGARIAVVGPNGAGKTTLLRMLAGELDPDAGVVARGHNVRMGYYAQHHAQVLDGRATILEEVGRLNPELSPTRVRSILGAFLFRGDDVEKRIGVLSGGERARVALARLLVQSTNVLLMDEPTNHLDLESSERLADALAGYEGALVFVSHNRSFVRRLATCIWEVSDRRLEVHPGTLDDYLARVEAKSKMREASASSTSVRDVKAGGRDKARRASRGKGRADTSKASAGRLKHLRKACAELEQKIAGLEQAQRERVVLLGDPDLYQDAERRDALLREHRDAAAELEQTMAEWMERSESLAHLEHETHAET